MRGRHLASAGGVRASRGRRVRPGRLAAAAGLLGGFASVGGCGLTADFSHLQDGGPVGQIGAPDAQAGVPDASAASSSFCVTVSPAPKFCDDFDEGQAVDTGWDTSELSSPGGTIALSTKAWSSPPASFSSQLFPLADPLSARLLKYVSEQSTHVHVELDMQLDPSNGAGTFEIVALHEVANDVAYGLFVVEDSGVLKVQLRRPNISDQSWTIGPAPSGWVHVTVDVNIGDSGSFTVQAGDASASQKNVVTTTDMADSKFVELGLYSYVAGQAQGYFDNITIDWN